MKSVSLKLALIVVLVSLLSSSVFVGQTHAAIRYEAPPATGPKKDTVESVRKEIVSTEKEIAKLNQKLTQLRLKLEELLNAQTVVSISIGRTADVTWSAGQKVTSGFTSTNLINKKVNIELESQTNGTRINVLRDLVVTKNSMVPEWTVPNTVVAGEYRIRVSCSASNPVGYRDCQTESVAVVTIEDLVGANTNNITAFTASTFTLEESVNTGKFVATVLEIKSKAQFSGELKLVCSSKSAIFGGSKKCGDVIFNVNVNTSTPFRNYLTRVDNDNSAVPVKLVLTGANGKKELNIVFPSRQSMLPTISVGTPKMLSWGVASTYTIPFTVKNLSGLGKKVDIALVNTKNGSRISVASNVNPPQENVTYEWKVPTSVPTGVNTYKISISCSASNPAGYRDCVGVGRDTIIINNPIRPAASVGSAISTETASNALASVFGQLVDVLIKLDDRLGDMVLR